jgi:hypothetical protein
MKLLWLGTSNDRYGEMPEEARAYRVAAGVLAEAAGEAVEVILKRAWPSPELPGIVESWMKRYQPDAAWLQVNNFSFCYESVPLKIERKLGRLGKPVAGAGVKASKVPWVASNAAFRGARRAAQLTIGGVTNFEPEDVIASIGETIRVIIRHEGVVLGVRGPTNQVHYYPSRRAAERAERRRQQVHTAIRAICRELHVEYVGLDRPGYVAGKVPTLADQVHQDVEAQRLAGLTEGKALASAWQAARGEAALVGR